MDKQASTHITLWDRQTIPRLGLGSWPIAGPFYSGDLQLGYGGVDDKDAVALLRHAADAGVSFFDTAAVYGAGHAEELFGQAFGNRSDIIIATKFGPIFDARTKQVTGESLDRGFPTRDVEASLGRLKRDHIDLYQLHLNSAAVPAAEAVFDELDTLVERGKIGAYGWSTDFPEKVAAVAGRGNFVAVQHAMNVFFDAPGMMDVVQRSGLISINRSPLAMGVLGGEIDGRTTIPANDVRANSFVWMDYFKGGRVAPGVIERLDRVRDLLTSGGRSLAQGALGWLWAKSDRTLPIPGVRSIRHLDDLLEGLRLGPLPASVMAEIESVIDRDEEAEPRER